MRRMGSCFFYADVLEWRAELHGDWQGVRGVLSLRSNVV